MPPPGLEAVEALLIDEEYLSKSKGFATLLPGPRSGEPLHLAEGKSRESLQGFFLALSPQAKAAIKAAGIDRSNAIKAAVQAHLPSA